MFGIPSFIVAGSFIPMAMYMKDGYKKQTRETNVFQHSDLYAAFACKRWVGTSSPGCCALSKAVRNHYKMVASGQIFVTSELKQLELKVGLKDPDFNYEETQMNRMFVMNPGLMVPLDFQLFYPMYWGKKVEGQEDENQRKGIKDCGGQLVSITHEFRCKQMHCTEVIGIVRNRVRCPRCTLSICFAKCAALIDSPVTLSIPRSPSLSFPTTDSSLYMHVTHIRVHIHTYTASIPDVPSPSNSAKRMAEKCHWLAMGLLLMFTR